MTELTAETELVHAAFLYVSRALAKGDRRVSES